MKLRHLFMAAVASLFAFAACEDIPEELIPSISVNPETLTFEAGEGSQTVSLKATLNWHATIDSGGSSWVALSQEKGDGAAEAQTISVSVQANEGNDRETSVVFSAGTGNIFKATLKISQKGAQGAYVVEEGDGSKEKPYSVAQAVDKIKDLTWTSASDYEKAGPFYVKGKIASIKYPYDFSNGTAQFEFSDDGSAAGVKLLAYSLLYLNNSKWLEGNTQIAVGDIVVVYGEFQNYQGKTLENIKGAYLYSLNGVTEDNNGHAPDFTNAPAKTIAEFIAAADASTYYKVTGTVYGTINAQYGNFYIKDTTGNLQVYGAANWAEWKDKVAVGKSVTVAGTYKKYNDTHEMVNGYILSCEEAAPVDYDNLPSTTVRELIAAGETGTMFKLTGKVSGSINATYGNFDLVDETGTIYIYGCDNWADWKDKVVADATVTLAGAYKKYTDKNGNVKDEIEGAHILSAEGGTIPDPVDYDNLPVATIADFIAGGETGTIYKLSGKVSGTINATYGNFDLVDETGTVYIYGCDNWADWKTQVKADAIVTLAGKYKKYVAADGTSKDEIEGAHILAVAEPPAVEGQIVLSIVEYAKANGWQYVKDNGEHHETFTYEDVTFTASWEGTNKNGIFYSTINEAGEIISGDWRFYQARKGGITIAAPDGKELKSVKFVFGNKNGGVIIAPDGTTQMASGSEAEISGRSALFTVGSSTGATNGQARITDIIVTLK